MQIIELRNPRALLNPTLVTFLDKAFSANALIAPGGINSVANDLYAWITRTDHFFILAVEDGRFVGMAMGFLPNSALFPLPTLSYAYVEPKAKGAKAALDAKVFDIISAAGYTSLWAWNASGRTDKVWERTFSGGKFKPERIGSVYVMKAK